MNTATNMMAAKPTDLLPLWVTVLWLVALAAALMYHSSHYLRMTGQHRWFHASHILMLVSMLYMFASMEFKWTWFPSSWWVVIFWISTVAMLGWMVLRIVQRSRFSFKWYFALIMQAAMIYMWMPNWAAPLTWAIVIYYGLETVAWLGGVLDDSKRARAVVSGDDAAMVAPAARDSAAGDGATGLSSVAVAVLDRPKRAMAFVPMGHHTAADRVGMAIMAASMGYMFAAMQLMRSAM